jgi:putative oxidoreductase
MKNMLFDSRDLGYWRADLGVFIVRAFAGSAMALGHGWGKLFHDGAFGPTEGFISYVAGLGLPAPVAMAWAAALSEVVGGALMAIGLLTRPAALAVATTMAVAAFRVHAADPIWGATPSKEMALLFLSISVMVFLAGPGRISVDRLIADDPDSRLRK